MIIKFELSLPSDTVSVPTVRHICRDALLELGVDAGCVADIETALSEACTNVLLHAEGTESDFVVAMDVDHESCRMRIVDTGRGFDHVTASGTETTVIMEGGRGIRLMEALVDRVSFASEPAGGTAVHLYKTLSLRPDSVGAQLQSRA
jgi:serine/threonine-protein kinase RsbW